VLALNPLQVRSTLLDAIATGSARVGVIGLGYVGLPLAVEFANTYRTIGFDVNQKRVDTVNSGKSHIGDADSETIAELVRVKRLAASADFKLLGQCDCVIICVPTPLEKSKEPDVSYILSAAREIRKYLRRGQLVVLESTTYPGTTEEMLLPMLEETGLRLDTDFLLAFSPERVDPGNTRFRISDIPKIVGGCSSDSSDVAAALYGKIVPSVHRVSSSRVAEAAKLWENTFRSVNIALANEMSILCRTLDIDTTEVIDAAKTKPFGFMPFYPGPGVGGHCIPLDPHYLSWKVRQHGYSPRFIQLADEVNCAMPDHIVEMVVDALNERGVALRDSRILILGVAYKEDVEDVRHSPALEIIDRLRQKRAFVSYHDPFVARLDFDPADLPATRRSAFDERNDKRKGGLQRPLLGGRRRTDPMESVELTDDELRRADCVVIITAHTTIDYTRVARETQLVIDTRNAVTAGEGATVVRL